MSWFSGTSDDDAIFNGYVIKLIEERKHELQSILYDVQQELDNLDSLTTRLADARINSDASIRCEHHISSKSYAARHDLLTALAQIAELNRNISYDLRV